ncbi:MerR family transcriptional regulator [Corallococcus interemptor]|uniref:MerR family transcriptional regulator n=1 Tax=Corallococcus interemptor TaxID=2316720 RepID=A0A3A8PLE8_9BACT|nr:MerR family transcriptional regulator [Corallococcus interemptor]RKH37767.1 MerR family transcriptional regulator [Corallococcus sp. AB050B]RKH57018.1 MerR family transcriptional regulator [Corallococcus interemptor]
MSTPKTQTEWKLAALAEEVGVSPRTVRYYVQRGLLPAPPFKGPDTVYGEEHRVRLKAIRVLQARFLPLDAIQAELLRLSPEELRRLSESPVGPGSGMPPVPEEPPRMPPKRPGKDPTVEVARYQRWLLAPGLELHVSEQAEAKVRALAERVRALIEESEEGTPS